MITPDWKQVDDQAEWNFVLEGAAPIANVRYLERAERESKNFRFEATIPGLPAGGRPDKHWGFRTVAGAKRFVENYFIQKGKLENVS